MEDRDSAGALADDDVIAYVNVLDHDILNNNQVVLGYLELLQATAYEPQRVKDYSKKAVSHLQICALWMDSMERILVRGAGATGGTVGPVPLGPMLEKAREDLAAIFPERSIKFATNTARIRPTADAELLSTIVLGVLVDLARIDGARDVVLDVSAARAPKDGLKAFRLTLSRRGVRLPPFLKRGLPNALREKDKSKMVKVTGILFAMLAARRLGGDMKIEEVGGPGTERGIACTLTLKEGAR